MILRLLTLFLLWILGLISPGGQGLDAFLILYQIARFFDLPGG